MKKCSVCDKFYNDDNDYCEICGSELFYVFFEDGKVVLLSDEELNFQKLQHDNTNVKSSNFSCSLLILLSISWIFISLFCLIFFGFFLTLFLTFIFLVFCLIMMYKYQNNKSFKNYTKHFVFGFFISIIAIYLLFNALVSIFTSVD